MRQEHRKSWMLRKMLQNVKKFLSTTISYPTGFLHYSKHKISIEGLKHYLYLSD